MGFERIDRRRPRAVAFVALVAALAVAPVPSPIAGGVGTAVAAERLVKVGGGAVEQLRVTKGKSETMRMSASFADLVVGDPDVADVVPLTDQSFYVLGKAVGQTNITVYDGKKQLVGIVDVEVSHDAARLQEELSKRVPGGSIRASSVNGKILLSGTAPDATGVERAVTIAKQFGPDVINSVSVGTSQQVMLEVRFVEVKRNAGRELGVNFTGKSSSITNTLSDGGNTSGTLPNGQSAGGLFTGAASLLSGSAPYGTGVVQLVADNLNVDLLIRALEERGVARRLAEPNLVALSGDTASFLAGGEIPIPVAAEDNKVTVTYKTYGVGLAFTPTVLDRGQINLKIIPEVSEIDTTDYYGTGTINVPSFVVRRANTTVELRDGQSLAIAGLLQSKSASAVQQLPWVGNLPVIGPLFRSTSFQKDETELVILITPRLVRPVAPGTALRTPADKLRPGTDRDIFLDGKLETRDDLVRFIAAGGRRPLLTGHILDLETGDKHVVQR
jgi:pilus assembly protein CpaC